MKNFRTISRFIVLFMVSMMFAISGWGANECTSTTNHSFTSIPGNSYSDNSITLANNAEKNYYFRLN